MKSLATDRLLLASAIILTALAAWFWFNRRAAAPAVPPPVPSTGATLSRPERARTAPQFRRTLVQPPASDRESSETAGLPPGAAPLRRTQPTEAPGAYVLAGQLVDQKREPIPEAVVTVRYPPPAAAPRPETATRETLSAPTGRFEFRFFRPVRLQIRLDASGYALLTEQVALSQPGRTERRYVLPRAETRLEGVVTDVFTRRPVVGATVKGSLLPTLQDGIPYRLNPPAVQTDKEGRFQIDRLPVERLDLKVSQFGYFDDSRSILPKPGGERLEIALIPADTYEFVVEDPNGSPIAGAEIVRPDGLTGHSDEQGRFHLPLIPELSSISIQVWKPGFQVARLELPMPPDTARIVLEPGFPLSGTVVDPRGNPLAGARLEVTDMGAFHVPPVTTNSRGEFTFLLSDRGPNTLRVSRDGFVATEVGVSEEPDRLWIVLEPAVCALTGRLLGLSAHGRGWVSVTLQRLDGNSSSGRQGAPVAVPEGTFRFENLAAGTYRLTAVEMISIPPPAPGSEADLTVRRGKQRLAQKKIRLNPHEKAHVVLRLQRQP